MPQRTVYPGKQIQYSAEDCTNTPNAPQLKVLFAPEESIGLRER